MCADPRNEKVIGIVGGMGPQSGIALLDRIVSHTRARTDQDHLSAILMSFPGRITDRTLFLEGMVQTNPAFSIAKIIKKLEFAGAGVAGIACNTSHAPRIYEVILGELEKSNSRIRLLHMPYETCRYVKEYHDAGRRIGVMTTNGTYKAHIYDQLLTDMGFEPLIPDPEFQDRVIHSMIYDPDYGIKANPQHISAEVKRLMDKAFDYFKNHHADCIILGCTELSLVGAGNTARGMTIADSTDIFARALIREARAAEHRIFS